jgi:hypothetical protein
VGKGVNCNRMNTLPQRAPLVFKKVLMHPFPLGESACYLSEYIFYSIYRERYSSLYIYYLFFFFFFYIYKRKKDIRKLATWLRALSRGAEGCIDHLLKTTSRERESPLILKRIDPIPSEGTPRALARIPHLSTSLRPILNQNTQYSTSHKEYYCYWHIILLSKSYLIALR